MWCSCITIYSLEDTREGGVYNKEGMHDVFRVMPSLTSCSCLVSRSSEVLQNELNMLLVLAYMTLSNLSLLMKVRLIAVRLTVDMPGQYVVERHSGSLFSAVDDGRWLM